MAEVPGGVPAASRSDFGPFGRMLAALARTSAIGGGLVFVALVAMSLASIIGRKLFALPVPGDVELLQMCAAFAASAFFAYCHLSGGDVKVDFFTHNFAPRNVALLDAFGSLLVGLFGFLIAWRTGVGAMSVYEVGETSAVLAVPVWIAMALMVPGFVLLGVAGFYMCGHKVVVAARAHYSEGQPQ